MAWPQPANNDVQLVKFYPAPSAGAMSPDQIADGKEYQNYGLISAGKVGQQTIAGQWLYRDNGGRVWAVDVQDSFNGAVVTLTITYSRFGFFTTQPQTVPQTYVRVITVNTGHPTPASFGLNFQNSAPNGRKAGFKVSSSGDHVSILEIDMGGSLTPTASIINSYTDRVEWIANVTTVDAGLTIFHANNTAGGTGYDWGCAASGGIPHQAILTATISGTYPLGIVNTVKEYTLTRVIGIFYNKASEAKLVKLRIKTTVEELNGDNPKSGGGGVARTKTWTSAMSSSGDPYGCDPHAWGGFIDSGITDVSSTEGRWHTWDRIFDADLMLGDTVVSNLHAENLHLNSNIRTSLWGVNGANDPTLSSAGIHGGPYYQNDNPTDTDSNIPINATIRADDGNWIIIVNNLMRDSYDAYVLAGNVPDGSENLVTVDGFTGFDLIDRRLNNNTWVLMYGEDVYANPNGTGEVDILFSSIATPDGADGLDVVADRSIKGTCYHPETEEVVREQTTPVSFV